MNSKGMPIDPLELVGPAELGALIKVSKNTISRMVACGELPPPRLLAGRRPRWRRAELEHWWQEQPRAAAGTRS